MSGVGLIFDRDRDVLSILDQAVVHIAPEEKDGSVTDITCGAATFARREHYRRFEKNVRIRRGAQVIESETAVATLREDGEHIETFELRGGARITTSDAAVGGLQALTGQEMNLKYGEDGLSLEQVLITGDAVIRIAGERGKAGTTDQRAVDRHRPGAGRRHAGRAHRARGRAAGVSARARGGRAHDHLDEPRREGRARSRPHARAVFDQRAVQRAGRGDRPRGAIGDPRRRTQERAERDRRSEIRARREVRGRPDGRAGGGGALRPRQGHARAQRHRARCRHAARGQRADCRRLPAGST